MSYNNTGEAIQDLFMDLLKKRERLQKNLVKTEIEIQLVQKQMNGGASLDEYFEDKKKVLGLEEEEMK